MTRKLDPKAKILSELISLEIQRFGWFQDVFQISRILPAASEEFVAETSRCHLIPVLPFDLETEPALYARCSKTAPNPMKGHISQPPLWIVVAVWLSSGQWTGNVLYVRFLLKGHWLIGKGPPSPSFSCLPSGRLKCEVWELKLTWSSWTHRQHRRCKPVLKMAGQKDRA